MSIGEMFAKEVATAFGSRQASLDLSEARP